MAQKRLQYSEDDMKKALEEIRNEAHIRVTLTKPKSEFNGGQSLK